jgi:ABC-2 type transport system permease protein
MGGDGSPQEALPMKFKNIWTLVKNEVIHSPKDVILIMAIVLPVLLTLFLNLAFGNIFSQRAKLGIIDQGRSGLVSALQREPSIVLKVYATESQLKTAAARGSIDIGFIFPSDFDIRVKSGNVEIKAFIWGESQPKNRAIISSVMADDIRRLNGADLPVTISTHPLGQGNDQPWNTRLMPMAILLAVFFGGLMIPAASLINEKNRHTLAALNVTPLKIAEIFTAKGVIGIILASIMGILTLIISGGLNSSFWSMVLILVIGAILAVEFGLLAGALIKELNTLYALWKFGALVLFGPAFIYIFPQIPQWIGYLFPTYYVIRPVMDISVNKAALSSEIIYLAVLIFLVLVLLALIRSLTKRIDTGALKIT